MEPRSRASRRWSPIGPEGDRVWPTGSWLEALLAVLWTMTVGAVAVQVVFLVTGTGADVETAASIALGIVAFQLAMWSWPVLVSRFAGEGLRRDWGFDIRLSDLPTGAMLAVASYVVATLFAIVARSLVALPTDTEATNTDVLTDWQHSGWIVLVVISVVVFAPIVEETLYRGLMLRSLQRSFGPIAAMLVSNTVFALLHWQFESDVTWQQNVVVVSALFGVGLVFTLAAMHFGRLGPAIIGHMVFNGVNTIFTFA